MRWIEAYSVRHRLVPILSMLAAGASALSGQTATATAERFVIAPDGEAVFLVRVQAPLTRSTAEIVEVLAPARVRADELAGRAASRSSPPLSSTSQEFLFRLVRPIERYTETQETLRGISASTRSGLQLWFNAFTQAADTAVERARANSLPGLFAEAKARAELMLTGAGFRPGAVVELAESITPQAGGVRLSLSVRMARVGAEQAGGAAISTMVTPPQAPHRVGPPRLEASYRARAGGRARLLELLAPAGLTEENLTGVYAQPDTFSRDREREPGPVTFTYSFSSAVSDTDALARLQRLPSPEGSSANVVYPVSPAPIDPLALVQAARARAERLASLLGGEVGESLGSAEAGRFLPISSTVTILVRGGDFSGLIRGIVLFNAVPDPPSTTPLRYRFGVAANATQ